MKQARQNLIIDVAAFVAFVLLAATGVVMVYVLPPGSGHATLLWGMGRHGWGDVHFWIAVAFMAFLAMHLVLHWKWIVAMIRGRGRPEARTRLRVGLGVLGLVVLMALAAAPLFAPTEQVRPPQERRGAAAHQGASGQRGAITLSEIAYVTGAPVEGLMRELGLPAHASPDEPLQQMSRRYGVEVEDVRRAIRAAVSAR